MFLVRSIGESSFLLRATPKSVEKRDFTPYRFDAKEFRSRTTANKAAEQLSALWEISAEVVEDDGTYGARR